MANFSVGDKVKHKTGGPVMVVKEVRSDAEIVCEWADNNTFHERVFPAALLQAWDDSPMMPLVVSDPKRGW